MRKRCGAYLSDLTDDQWLAIAPTISTARPAGRARNANGCEIVDAILHLLRAGCPWRLLHQDFPPWQTARHHLHHQRLREREGVRARAHHALAMANRKLKGREPSPLARVIDSETLPSAAGPMAKASAAMIEALPAVEISFRESVAPLTNLRAVIRGAGPGGGWC